MRLAYVAQHAFHHLEESLDISPVRYILRRYLGGEDKEEASKVHRTYTEEEWEKVRKQVRGRSEQSYPVDNLSIEMLAASICPFTLLTASSSVPPRGTQVWIIDKQNRILDKIIGRRKKRRSFEYEVS